MKSVTPVVRLGALYAGVVLVVGLLALARGEVSDDPVSTSGSAAAAPNAASDVPTDAPTSPTVTAGPPNAVTTYDQLTPAPEDADDDRPDLYDDDCQLGPDDELQTRCAYGAPAAEASATIAVVGDSKAGQWTPALQVLAESRGWRILIFTKSTCPPVLIPVSRNGEEYTTCARYMRRVGRTLETFPVDLILTSSSVYNPILPGSAAGGRAAEVAASDAYVEGLKQNWARWVAAGNRVAVISDTPRPTADGESFDVATCLQENRDDLLACAYDRGPGLAASGRDAQKRAVRDARAFNVSSALYGVDLPRRAALVDLAWIDPIPLMCPGETCLPYVGDLLVYREGSHLSRTFVESLSERLGLAMTALGLP